MPDEVFVVAMLAITCGTAVVVSIIIAIARHQRARLNASAGTPGGSLTASELRRILEEAVANATRPLQEQLDELEGLLRAEGRALPSRNEPKALPGARPSLQGALDPLGDPLDDVLGDEARVPRARPRSRS